MQRKTGGFTLIELLVVIAIIAILAAILFPVFATARLYSKNAGCISNLRQISAAFSQYYRDWDDHFPLGLDASDYYASVFDSYDPPNIPQDIKIQVRATAKELQKRPDRGGMLDQVMLPYITTTQVWHCPADNGVGFLNLPESPEQFNSGQKNCYEAFHMSYGYHTELGLLHRRISSLKQSSNTLVLYDSAGYWHTHYSRPSRKVNDIGDNERWHYNTLFADGHCKNVNQQEMSLLWEFNN